MPAASLPPWLNIQPTDFVQASEAGAGAGLNLAKTKIQSQEFQQEMGLRVRSHMDDMAMKQQAFQQEEQDRQARVQQAQEQHQLSAQNLQMETQRAQVEKQTSQMKMMIEATDAARKFQAQQKYQQIFGQLTQSGVDPSTASMQAILQAGPSDLGESGASTASILKQSRPFVPQEMSMPSGVDMVSTGPQSWAQVPPRISATATQMKDDSGKPIPGFFTDGKSIIDANKDPIAQQRADDYRAQLEDRKTQAQINSRINTAKMLAGALSKMVNTRDPSYIRLNKELQQTIDEIRQLGGSVTEEDSSAADAAPSGATKIGRFSMQVVGP